MSCKASVGFAHGGDKLVDLVSVFDALEGFTVRAIGFDAGAHIHRQRFTTRAHLQDAVGHICSSEPTTSDEVSIDVWRKQ